MSAEVRERVRAVTRRAYQPYQTAEELFRALISGALEWTGCARASVEVPGLCAVDEELPARRQGRGTRRSPPRPAVTQSVNGRGRRADARGDARAATTCRRTPDSEDAAADILYAERQIGTLRWTTGLSNLPADYLKHFFGQLARDLGFFAHRYEVQARVAHRWHGFLLVGTSDGLREAERFIERSADVDLPVIIGGEPGSGKPQIAHAIHCASSRRDGPFVEVQCAAPPDDDVEAWHARSRDGTLLLSDVDLLDADCQARLLGLLRSKGRAWSGAGADQTPASVRIMASVSGPLERDTGATLSSALLAELSFLRFEMPTLRERRDDIRALVQHAFRKHRRRISQELSEEFLRSCEQYPWPGNQFELERVVARVAALADTGCLDAESLRALAPEVLAMSGGRDGAPLVSGEQEGTMDDSGGDRPSLQDLVVAISNGEAEPDGYFHPRLAAALRYIQANYRDEISLGQLARAAFVSTSHLSFLFRSSIGVPFKPFLAMVRIEEAKRLLVTESKRRITDISLDVGFGDLSHFERTFKRLVRVNPREYRRRELEAQSALE